MTPKATIKPEKKYYVNSLAETLKSAKSAVFVDYSGLGVKAQQELKKTLKNVGSNMFVAKNTLLKLAGESSNLPKEAFEDKFLSGQTAVVISEKDPVIPVQILGKFIKDNNIMAFKSGVVEGSFQDSESLTKISKLPGKQELQANVIGAIAAPMYALVGSLNTPAQKLLYILSEAQKNHNLGGDN